jgi:hypothetical protein
MIYSNVIRICNAMTCLPYGVGLHKCTRSALYMQIIWGRLHVLLAVVLVFFEINTLGGQLF